MKKVTITLIAVFTILIYTAQAKIWRVNNNSGVVADFTSIQAAHDGAASGDTIHLEPSVNGYGDVTMNKRLVIIGTGQFLTQNPGIQFDPKAPYIGSMNINNTGANNSVIMVRFTGNLSVNSGVSGVTFSNCAATAVSDGYWNFGRAGTIFVDNADNIVVKNCMLNFVRFVNNSNNLVCTNNIISYAVINDGGSDGIVSNNVIHAIGVSNEGESLNNCVVGNNIFNKTVQTSFFNSNLSNNLAPNTGIPADNNNQQNVDMSTVFVDASGGFLDNIYQLKTGSPAIGAGGGGVDCGAFGGSSPFKLAVTPPIPSIYKMALPATPSGSSMTLTFSTKSNN